MAKTLLNTYIWNTLYKKTSSGKLVSWIISVTDNIITINWGEIGGKIQTKNDVIKEGKNLGRSNATTPAQQARREAQSRWDKQVKKGYVEDLEMAKAGQASDMFGQGSIIPMKAHVYADHKDKIVFPCMVQPKLDGHRCTAMFDSKGNATLWSYKRIPIVSLPHIITYYNTLGIRDTTLDGELYNHEYHQKFESLTSFIKRDTPKKGHEVVQHHVYDVVDFTLQNSAREAMRKALLVRVKHPIVSVDTFIAHSHEEVAKLLEQFVAAGYEGAIIRNMKGMYKADYRSYDVIKWKEFDDSEFTVVDVVEAEKEPGTGLFVFALPDIDDTFTARWKAPVKKRQKLLENKDKYIGQSWTVRYKGFTAYKKPRHPVAIRERKDV